jgi:hypothetical protein
MGAHSACGTEPVAAEIIANAAVESKTTAVTLKPHILIRNGVFSFEIQRLYAEVCRCSSGIVTSQKLAKCMQ